MTVERAIWTAIPCGTAQSGRRFSVVISPRIEGMGRITVADLQRFNRWPDELATITPAVWIDGVKVDARNVRRVTDPKLIPDDSLWQTLFEQDLDVDLVELAQATAQAQSERVPLVPPTSRSVAAFKQVYRERALAQARGETIEQVTADGIQVQSAARPLDSWTCYIDELEYLTGGGGNNIVLASEASSDVERLMAIQELFHSRPPIPVFPDLIRDEREIQSNGNGTFAQSLATGDLSLLPSLRATQSAHFSVQAESGIVTAMSGDAISRVAAHPAEKVAGGALGFRLRPGDSIELQPGLTQWDCVHAIVQIHEKDNGTILYGRPVCAESGQGHPLEFVLPSDAAEGFRVTVRNLHTDSLPEVKAGGEVIKPGYGLVFVREGGKWRSEPENRDEFHRRVATLRAYPAILRRLGLVIDMVLDQGVLLKDVGHIRVVPSGGVSAEDLCTWTSYQFTDGGLFLPTDRKNTKSLIRGGFLQNDRDRSRLKIAQMDGDSAALKNLEQLRTETVHANALAQRLNDVLLDARGNPERRRDLPSLRQIGIALCDRASASDTSAALQRAASVMSALCTAKASCPERADSKINDPLQATVELCAEDLVMGYRIDVLRRSAKGTTGSWRSLCERTGEYFFSGTAMTDCADWCWSEEGFISQTADEVRDPNATRSGLRQSEAIFRWDGWSLVAPKPGARFSETGPGLSAEKEGANTSAPVRARFKAKTGSLERLRLGDRYSFRARTVDLAGNSLDLCEADAVVGNDFADLRVFNSSCYERPEPLAPPIVIPVERPGPGEGNDQLAIRSQKLLTLPRTWLFLPPGVSPSFTELHGVMDGMRAREAWAMLRGQDERTPDWTSDSRGHDARWIDYGRNYLNNTFRVPYLPDPLTDKVVFRQGRRVVAAMNLTTGWLAARYPENIVGRFVRLEYAKHPRIGMSSMQMEVGLPPGRMAKVEIHTVPASSSLPVFGVAKWCECKSKEQNPHDPCDEIEPVPSDAQAIGSDRLSVVACSGQIGLITPGREITFVHAIEKPLPPEGRELAFVTDQKFRFGNPIEVDLRQCDTADGKTTGCAFDVTGSIWIDRPSTGRIDVRLDWTEPIDNPQVPDVIHRSHALEAFQVPVRLEEADYVQFTETVPECGSGAPPASPKCVAPQPFPINGHVRFDDGRHRRVSVTFDATSRFVDFFEQDVVASEAGERPANGKDPKRRFRRRSEPVIVHFPARVEPAPPTPVYAVPTFRQVEARSGRETRVHRRGGLRIFVGRDWFSSGESEKLAVIFAPTRSTKLERPFNEVVSMWGADPLWEPDETDRAPYDRLGTRMPVMPERPVLSDVLNAEDAIESLITPLRIVPADDKKPVELGEVELALAAYTPQLDEQKNLWFIDLDIAAPTYFSFLRLGLARYQPYAEEGRSLSAIIPATICQLVPDVSISIIPGRKRCFEITVLAPAAVSEGPQTSRIARTFEAIVVRGSQSTGNVPSALLANTTSVVLEHVGDGDGQAKWRGVIPADEAGFCPQFVVMEKQAWPDMRSRVVGAIHIRRS